MPSYGLTLVQGHPCSRQAGVALAEHGGAYVRAESARRGPVAGTGAGVAGMPSAAVRSRTLAIAGGLAICATIARC